MSNSSSPLLRLIKPRGFAWLSVSTLTLGVAACSVIFAIFNAAFFQPLPIHDETNVSVLSTVELEKSGQLGGWSYLNFVELRQALKSQQLIDSAVALDVNERSLAVRANAPNQPVRVALATQGLTRTMGAVPILGRDFSESEEIGRAQNEAVPMLISERLWRDQLDADPNVLGRTLYLDTQARRVVGVLPNGLIADSLNPIDCWVSSAESGDSAVPGSANASRSYPYLRLMLVRRAAGVSAEHLAERAGQSFATLVKRYPEANAGRGTSVLTVRAYLMRAQQPLLQLLLAMAVVVVLMVCLNLANVSLARVAKRTPEFQTRIDLGAGVPRLLAGVSWENVRLALLAATLALPLIALVLRLSEPLIRSQLDNLGSLRLDPTLVVFTLLLSLAIALLSSSASLLFVARLQQQRSGSATRSIFGSRSQQSMRKFLVVAQLALTLCLLISASLLLQSLRGLTQVNPGFAYAQRLVLSLQFDGEGYSNPARLLSRLDELKSRLQQLPGVQSLSFAQATPLGESNNSTQFNRSLQPFARNALPDAGLRFVDNDYADTLAIAMRDGRFFASQDQRDSPAVVIVNQAFAKAFFPDISPLGQRLQLGWGGEGDKTIIGVISDVRHTGLSDAASPEFYVPLAQFPLRSLKLVVQVLPGSEAELSKRMRETIAGFDSQISIGLLTSLETLREAKLAQPAFLASVISAMALVALGLGAFGLFALLSYLLQLRSAEFALRLALGAQRSAIWVLLYRQLAAMWLWAVLIGAAMAVLAPTLLQHWLLDLSGSASNVASVAQSAPTSVGAWMAALFVLSLAMCAACIGPGYRAANTNLRGGLSNG